MTAIVILDLLVWPVPLAQVLPGPQLILGENLRGIGMWLWCCWKDLDEQDLMKIQINSLNLAHRDLSNNTKATFQFLWDFHLRFYFILFFSEEIIQYSRTFALQVQTLWNQADAPFLIESFPKRPRTWSEASRFNGSHGYKTKQTTFLHR